MSEEEKYVGMRKADQDIHYVRVKLDEFIEIARTPMRVAAWTVMAMIAGITGALGMKVYAVLYKLLGRIGP